MIANFLVGGRQLFYSRKQSKTVFNFYIENQQLVVETVGDGKVATLQIDKKDLPIVWQSDIDAEKSAKLKRMFEQSFFTLHDDKVLIRGYGLGGWGPEQHAGYEPLVSETNKGYSIIRFGYFDENCSRQAVGGGYGCPQGTYQWAINFGFCSHQRHDIKLYDIPAARIAYYSNSVDFDISTNPVVPVLPLLVSPASWLIINPLKPQGWHFNTECQTKDGSIDDIRIHHSLEQLVRAVSLRKGLPQNNFHFLDSVARAITVKPCRRKKSSPKDKEREIGKALIELGRGLHPLQDVFAHTKEFVTGFTVDFFGIQQGFKEHLWGKPDCKHADDPNFLDAKKNSPKSAIAEPECIGAKIPVNQRYSDTKTATLVYLLLYRLATEPLFVYSGEYARLLRLKSGIINAGTTNEKIIDLLGRLQNSNHALFSVAKFTAEFVKKLRESNGGEIPASAIAVLDEEKGETKMAELPIGIASKDYIHFAQTTIEVLVADITRLADLVGEIPPLLKKRGREMAELPTLVEAIGKKGILDKKEALDKNTWKIIMQCQSMIKNGVPDKEEFLALLMKIKEHMKIFEKNAYACRCTCKGVPGKLSDMRLLSSSVLTTIKQFSKLDPLLPTTMKTRIEHNQYVSQSQQVASYSDIKTFNNTSSSTNTGKLSSFSNTVLINTTNSNSSSSSSNSMFVNPGNTSATLFGSNKISGFIDLESTEFSH